MSEAINKRLAAVRWGIIGCGDVTEVKSGPAFNRVANSELVAVMRRDGAKAADYARRHGVRCWFDNADQLIAHPEVEAVYIATPPANHLEYALKVCSAGKPAYVEKPMASNYPDCLAMIEAFQRARLPLFVAYYRRALPRFRRIKAMIGEGAIGRLTSIGYRYASGTAKTPDPAALPWRLDPRISGGGLFVDIGCHVLDLLDFLVGPLLECTGHAMSTGHVPGVEDLVGLNFVTDKGVLGTASWNFESYVSEDVVEFSGTKGRISTAVMAEAPIELRTANGAEYVSIPNPPHIQQPLIQTVVDDLLGSGVCDSTGVSAARTSKIIDDVLSPFYGRPKL